jgi:hypothetical protein
LIASLQESHPALSDAPQLIILIIGDIDSPETVVCCFCLEEVFPLHGCVIRPCEHVFHADCFLKDFSHNQISRCPECRCEYLYEPFSSEAIPQPMEGIEDTGPAFAFSISGSTSLPNNATTIHVAETFSRDFRPNFQTQFKPKHDEN